MSRFPTNQNHQTTLPLQVTAGEFPPNLAFFVAIIPSRLHFGYQVFRKARIGFKMDLTVHLGIHLGKPLAGTLFGPFAEKAGIVFNH